ncbi:MAG: hypothetical protein U5L72_07365 [Bacteroidales bacterium]|nr:hypothetical protein [Bacteroidales bacterium]
MEDTEGNCPYDHNGDLLKSHCCEDVLMDYGMDNNYTPAAKTAAEFSSTKIAVPDLPFVSPARFTYNQSQACTDISPPGLLLTSSVDLTAIRVLRI